MLQYLLFLKVLLSVHYVEAMAQVGQDSNVGQFVEPYVGSYQVEDSCQFQLCGQEFTEEFGVGVSPSHGSCSGDCHDLAASLINNKFTKDFLWSKCSTMCSDKYNFSTFSDYKSRLSCMSSCFSLYSPLAPHHNLARYCIQASCPDHHHGDDSQQLHQLDCFSQCSSHVTRRVSSRDWEQWAKALTGQCQNDKSASGRFHRLQCADDAVWNNTISKVSHQEIDTISSHCRNEICLGNLGCARNCLEHLLEAAPQTERMSMWMTCSLSTECSPACSSADDCSLERLSCSDSCVENKIQRLRKLEEMTSSEQLAILANTSSTVSLAWLVLTSSLSFLKLSLL